MISLSSRYADGLLLQGYHLVKKEYQLGVYRIFPENVSGIFYYTWVENDRLDLIASKFLGDSRLWWAILDFNSEIHDAFDFVPGQQVRIPLNVL